MSRRRFSLTLQRTFFSKNLVPPFKKLFLLLIPPLLSYVNQRPVLSQIFKKVSGTERQALRSASNCPFYYSTDKMMRGVTVLSQRGQKRSACHYDKRFVFASIIRANPLYPFDRIQFSASADRHRLPRPAAARAGRTPDRVRSADARSRRGSAAWHLLLCG